MKAVRAFLIFLWVVFGLTATAHAMPATATVSPCGMSSSEMTHMPHAPKQTQRDDQGAMPCCSQPVVVAPDEITVPAVLPAERLRLSPGPVAVLSGLILPSEPRPPQTV